MHKKDWSEKHLKRMIVEQRKHMWRDDSIEMYSRWMALKPGMTAIDVGCGLGYLGWTYWKYFGNGGRYFGLDKSFGLLEEAYSMSSDWARGGTALFQQGDVYKLPFPDNFADWTMCQTLLMHLEFPEKALAEMVRVTKPGGLIMCNEPDNISASRKVVHFSGMDVSDEYILQNHKMMLIWARGRKKLGHGDYSIAVKIPMMMHDLGLVKIDSRCNDTCNFVQPPYETPRQKNTLEMTKKSFDEGEESNNKWQKEYREFFLAGGGSLSSFYRYMKKNESVTEEFKQLHKEQIENGIWHCCWGASSFFCIKSRKAILPVQKRVPASARQAQLPVQKRVPASARQAILPVQKPVPAKVSRGKQ